MTKLTNEQIMYKRKTKKPGFAYTLLGGDLETFHV